MQDDHSPRIECLYVTHGAGEPMCAVTSVCAIAERGLKGDRYCEGKGTYSAYTDRGWGANVTLIQSEAIEAINQGHQTEFTGEMLRRNIVTSNIKLESLVGHHFRCGSATLKATKQFPPCAHLALLLDCREVLKYFAYCGGIGATVVAGGEFKVGDRIEVLV